MNDIQEVMSKAENKLVDVFVYDLQHGGSNFYNDHLFDITQNEVVLWNPYSKLDHLNEILIERVASIRDHKTGEIFYTR